MREYISINEKRLRMYVDQARRGKLERSVTTSLKIGVPPSLELSSSGVHRDPNIYQDTEWLLEYLRDNDLLDAYRPNVEYATYREFVYETMEATKVLLPRRVFEDLEELGGEPSSATVWVSDPKEEEEVSYFLDEADVLRFTGAFLYLIEAHWEGWPYSTRDVRMLGSTALGGSPADWVCQSSRRSAAGTVGKRELRTSH